MNELKDVLINSTKKSSQPKADLIWFNGYCNKGHSGRFIAAVELTWSLSHEANYSTQ